MKEILQKEIENILQDLGVQNPKVSFDYPARMDFGDLSTNVAMVYAKELSKNPLELSNEIKEILAHTQCAQVWKKYRENFERWSSFRQRFQFGEAESNY